MASNDLTASTDEKGSGDSVKGVKTRNAGLKKKINSVKKDSNSGSNENIKSTGAENSKNNATITKKEESNIVSENNQKLKKEDDVPELDDEPPPSVVVQKPSITSSSPSLRLRSKPKIEELKKTKENNIKEALPKQEEMVVIEVPDNDDGADTPVDHLEGMTVIDEVEGDQCDNDDEVEKTASASIDPDTEMVSEDELPTESSKQLETEAVSDDELPTPTVDLPETEAVSEDELPLDGTEKKKKKKSLSKSVKIKSAEKVKKVKEEIKSDGENLKRKKLPEEYDPSSPTSEDGVELPPAKKPAIEVKPSKLPELEKFWKAVKDEPKDFTGWTYLLQYVDSESDVEAAREAYNEFLKRYPYCYGYWRKYADYEKRKGNKKECEEVFERGLKAIPLSMDLWIHYLNYCRATNADNEEFVRTQFQKALDACGLEFRSDRLWDCFIKWETEGNHLQNVTALYDRLISIPTQGYASHFESFMEHIKNNLPSKVLSVDEFLTLRREVLQVLKQYDTPLSNQDGPPGDDAAPPGEESPETIVASDEETTALRERIIQIRRKIHKENTAAVTARFTFEEGVKRPYFHVKPLERCQLKNWKEYLDFEIEQGDKKRIIILFERCLVACALYEDFWMKFIRYLEDLTDDNNEKIRDVYRRACLIHHPTKPNLLLHWAMYEENQGNFSEAREILANLETNVPHLLQIAYRRINLERRAGNNEEAVKLYDHYINTIKSKIISNNMSIKYARFCWKSLNDVDKAIQILKNAVEKDKENPRLYLQLIDMEMQKPTIQEDEVLSIMDKFINRETADMDQKLMFAQRKVEFLEDFGSCVKKVHKASEEFRKYLKSVQEKKKKSLETATKTHKSEEKEKKVKSDTNQNSNSSVSQSNQAAPVASGVVSNAAPNNPVSYGGSHQYIPPAVGYQGANQSYPPAQSTYSQQPYQGSDNYSNYQGWNYNHTGYGGAYNQGWGNYNYYQ